MEHPERREAGGRVRLRWGDQDERERADKVDKDPTAEGSTEEEFPPEDAPQEESGAEVKDPDEIRRRLEAKDQYIQELHEEPAVARVTADEAEERGRRRRREGQDRRVARLERELERRENDIRHLEDLLEENEEVLADQSREAQEAASRKDAALEEALRRIEGLERDLEGREVEVAQLKATVNEARAELNHEYDLRQRMAEPENRLRAGIMLFNDSEHHQEVASISKSLGQPEVHVSLGSGDEPPAILTFTWRNITWRTYNANPGPDVKEPRVYLEAAGEDLAGVKREPSNAHVDSGGRVLLGL